MNVRILLKRFDLTTLSKKLWSSAEHCSKRLKEKWIFLSGLNKLPLPMLPDLQAQPPLAIFFSRGTTDVSILCMYYIKEVWKQLSSLAFLHQIYPQ